VSLYIENETDYNIGVDILKRIKDHLSDKTVELTFVLDEKMREINLQNRGVDKSTDVLSFPIEPFANAPLGEIVINLDRAFKDAKNLGHSLDSEVALLFIHGMLHLLGYDHEEDNGQMREEERRLIEEFDLPKSLIIRSEDDN
jgi:probable rRNA maturation factor